MLDSSAFNWTQFPQIGLGPGIELFGSVSGLRVVDLGCGDGRQLALIASMGANGIGIDVSDLQIERARRRWSSSRLAPTFVCSDAFLLTDCVGIETVDIVYSVFGAIGLSNPVVLLPEVYRSLRPGGRLIFSVRHPVWDTMTACFDPFSANISALGSASSGRLDVRLPISETCIPPVVRYQLPVDSWIDVLMNAGFSIKDLREIAIERQQLKHLCMSPHYLDMRQHLTPCTLIFIAAKTTAHS